MPQYLEYVATAADAGLLLREVIKREFRVSASMLAKLKRIENGITVDGVCVTVRYVMRPGDVVRLLTETLDRRSVAATPGSLDILYEDKWIMVLCKPHGIPVHPSRGHYDDTLANRVVYHYRQSGQECVFRVMNRLDKGTGGLMCVAKTQYAAQIIGTELAAGGMEREYTAVIDGHLPEDAGIIDLPIDRKPGSGIERHVSKTGKRAVTHYRIIGKTRTKSLVHIKLETGRTHQIRVHMAYMGCPVIGDFLYGTERPEQNGHALFAGRLAFHHPESGAALVFQREIPPFFETLMAEDG